MSAESWMRLAGAITWLLSAVPIFTRVWSGSLSGAPGAFAIGAFAAFGAAFWVHARPHTPYAQRRAIAMLAVQSISGLVMIMLTRDTRPAATLVIVAAQLPYVFVMREAALWLGAQSVVLAIYLWRLDGVLTALSVGGAFVGFQLFALATAWFARSESLARNALDRANAELTATRELLAENSRVAERLRIARDLHDTLGHHLTALSIQLDVASRLSSGAGATHIREAHAVAKLLLSDVRDVVSTLRGSNRIDLSQAVRSLASVSGAVTIHLDMPARLDLEDGAQAHALLRCVQEIITNAARHASAQNLWITIEQSADGIKLHARDDGRGVPELLCGNGLRGMRERFEEYAGRIEFRSAAGEGFEVRGFMPRPEPA